LQVPEKPGENARLSVMLDMRISPVIKLSRCQLPDRPRRGYAEVSGPDPLSPIDCTARATAARDHQGGFAVTPEMLGFGAMLADFALQLCSENIVGGSALFAVISFVQVTKEM
jgi:hypothetical protein